MLNIREAGDVPLTFEKLRQRRAAEKGVCFSELPPLDGSPNP
jgi:hypothetical protein